MRTGNDPDAWTQRGLPDLAVPPGAAGTPPVKEHAARLSPGRRAVLGGHVMTSMFGPNGQHVLVLIACIPGLSADQVDQVTSAWKQGSARDRARAWAQLNRAAAGDERYRILAAASLARREALGTARRMHRADWAFWAAACDAGAAVAVGARIGRHYDTLVAPFAQVVPALVRDPAAAPGSAAASAAGPQAAPGIPAKSA